MDAKEQIRSMTMDTDSMVNKIENHDLALKVIHETQGELM